VKDALQKLDDAGHLAYVVGGSVRDFLLGRESKDHDIATSAGPDELCALFPDAVTVGKAFGVLKVPLRGKGTAEFLEIATFRQDLEYRDHRHPQGVLFAGPSEDARRRDFTVNALFYDAKTSRILDTVGGLDDLKARVIRAIGDPSERFKEDALRLLRAVRFSVALDFRLDPETAKAVQARARLVTRVSSERVRDELTLMLTGPRPGEAVSELSRLGLLGQVLPEVEALKGLKLPAGESTRMQPWTHTLKVLEKLAAQVPARPPVLAWATLLREIGKAAAARRSGGKNFNGHEKDGARLAFSVAERLRLPRADCDAISAMVGDQLKFRDVFQMREATLLRFVRQPGFAELLAMHRADATATDGNLAYYEFCASRLDQVRREPADAGKLLTGEDLIQLGLRPGPRFSEILRTVEDLALERRLRTKEEALEYVVKHFVK
jgi:poly(A) polymerase